MLNCTHFCLNTRSPLRLCKAVLIVSFFLFCGALMLSSIRPAGILNMNMFGIPFVGSDICGFLDESTAELCARWMQVGALYPFSRNHNSVNNRPQAPFDFETTPELDVVSVSRRALATRYQLLPYYYSLLFQSSLVGGSTVRPLFMEFPLQTECWAVQEQFMIGSALLATPVLREGYRNVTGRCCVSTLESAAVRLRARVVLFI